MYLWVSLHMLTPLAYPVQCIPLSLPLSPFRSKSSQVKLITQVKLNRSSQVSSFVTDSDVFPRLDSLLDASTR